MSRSFLCLSLPFPLNLCPVPRATWKASACASPQCMLPALHPAILPAPALISALVSAQSTRLRVG